MDKRSESSHMDFEWQNKSGPIDPTSPWAQIPKPDENKKRETDNMAKKRPHSILDSPGKAATFPGLRDPAPSQTFLFSQNPAFTTPRKFEPDYASSEAEAASSPDNNADSEATPEMGIRSGLAKTGKVFTHILDQTKDSKTPAFAKLNGVAGRGDISRGPYSHAIERRVRKNRRRDTEKRLAMRRRNSASDSDGEDSNKTSDQTKNKPGAIASLFGFIDTHPNLPHILSFYAQLTLNIFIVFFIIYLIYSFWSTIRSDVDKKSAEAAQEVMKELAACAAEFKQNRCSEADRPPALAAVCDNWESCMKKDPNSVGRARVSANTFAEIFNSFIEPISWKAMFFVSFLVFGSLLFSNFAFYFFRNKISSQVPAIPPTPSHSASHPYMPPNPEHNVQYWNNPYGSPIPPPSAQQQHPTTMIMGRDDPVSPTRRLQYY